MYTLFLALALALGSTSAVEPKAEPVLVTEQEEFVPGMVIVQFQDASRAQETIQTLEQNKEIIFDKMLFDDDTLRIGLFTVPQGQEQAYVDKIAQMDNVAIVELNGIGSFN